MLPAHDIYSKALSLCSLDLLFKYDSFKFQLKLDQDIANLINFVFFYQLSIYEFILIIICLFSIIICYFSIIYRFLLAFRYNQDLNFYLY